MNKCDLLKMNEEFHKNSCNIPYAVKSLLYFCNTNHLLDFRTEDDADHISTTFQNAADVLNAFAEVSLPEYAFYIYMKGEKIGEFADEVYWQSNSVSNKKISRKAIKTCRMLKILYKTYFPNKNLRSILANALEYDFSDYDKYLYD